MVGQKGNELFRFLLYKNYERVLKNLTPRIWDLFGILGSFRWNPDLLVDLLVDYPIDDPIEDPDPLQDSDLFSDQDFIFLLNIFKIQQFCSCSKHFHLGFSP